MGDPKPIGDPVRISGEGEGMKKHYDSFEFDGNHYALEDTVLLVPDDIHQKPDVAIIKDITQSQNGSVMVTGQRFYHPEEAERKGGGSWQSSDQRELFYSFHREDDPADSVMHKCVVHFVPINKQFPKKKQHPGFIVQKVYDTTEKKLWMLTGKDSDDIKQQEIAELVQKTLQRVGELLDIENEKAPEDREQLMKRKRSLREEEGNPRGNRRLKPATPRNCVNNASEYHHILKNFHALTGDAHRDKWLERLLQSVKYVCNSDDGMDRDDKGSQIVNSDATNNKELANDGNDKGQKSSKSIIWPDVAVSAIAALEEASHDAFTSDLQKYYQKLRQLSFYLKTNALLARRLLNGELVPPMILSMTPNELKEGFTAEEIVKNEPDGVTAHAGGYHPCGI